MPDALDRRTKRLQKATRRQQPQEQADPLAEYWPTFGIAIVSTDQVSGTANARPEGWVPMTPEEKHEAERIRNETQQAIAVWLAEDAKQHNVKQPYAPISLQYLRGEHEPAYCRFNVPWRMRPPMHYGDRFTASLVLAMIADDHFPGLIEWPDHVPDHDEELPDPEPEQPKDALSQAEMVLHAAQEQRCKSR